MKLSGKASLMCCLWLLPILLTLTPKSTCEGRRTRRIRLFLTLFGRDRRSHIVKNTKTKHAILTKEPWEINRGVCPPSLCAWHEESKSHRPRNSGSGDSSPFYNGDIVLDEDIRTILLGIKRGQQRKRHRTKRATVRQKNRLWPRGKVPYLFTKELSSKSRRAIRQAMRHIENQTCIQFKKRRPKDVDYLYFINEPGCWSYIGRVQGQQKISLGDGCEFFGTSLHEISHSIGFWHEQSRPDRNKYVRILTQNISPKSVSEFDVSNSTTTSSRGYAYDYHSVTHYSERSFTVNGKPTIEVIGPGKKLGLKIGQRKGLSTLDIAQLRDMYKCNHRQDSSETVCANGWQKLRSSCYKFMFKPRLQFAAASTYCKRLRAKLVSIDSRREDEFLKTHLSTHHSHAQIWRTGGRKLNRKFVWHDGMRDKNKPMKYKKWTTGQPDKYSSVALVRTTNKTFIWKGVWSGSQSQMPSYAYPFICEKQTQRKCFHSKYKDGRDYRGRLNHTKHRVNCQKWSSQWPHRHEITINTKSRQADGLGDHNYCRNPTKQRRKRPWCLTSKSGVKWEYCAVTIC